MSDVKRYDCYGKDALGYDYSALSREAIDGDWVLAEDHIAECDALAARLAESEAECLEQARLNGMGSEREARLIARLAKAERLLESGMIRLIQRDEFGQVGFHLYKGLDLRKCITEAIEAERPSDSAPAVTCDHFPGQTACEWCHGTGAIDAPTSADDPSCPDCDGEGHV